MSGCQIGHRTNCHLKNTNSPSPFKAVGFVIEELSVDDDIWEFLGYVEYDED